VIILVFVLTNKENNKVFSLINNVLPFISHKVKSEIPADVARGDARNDASAVGFAYAGTFGDRPV
jgi:hypothetical protein